MPDFLLPDWLWIALVVVFALYLLGVRVEVGSGVEVEEGVEVEGRRAVELYVDGKIDVDELERRLDAIYRPELAGWGPPVYVYSPDGERIEVRVPPRPSG